LVSYQPYYKIITSDFFIFLFFTKKIFKRIKKILVDMFYLFIFILIGQN